MVVLVFNLGDTINCWGRVVLDNRLASRGLWCWAEICGELKNVLGVSCGTELPAED